MQEVSGSIPLGSTNFLDSDPPNVTRSKATADIPSRLPWMLAGSNHTT
jgi:hypothetical protein